MLLAIDIGNTSTVLGIFKDGGLASFYRVTSRQSLTEDEAGLQVRLLFGAESLERLRRVVICSVVPSLTSAYQQMSQKYLQLKAIVVTSNLKLGLKIRYKDPSQVGADRLANAVAAKKLYKLPCIIVDLGTATTFDVISKRGEYLGGAIAPGIETSSSELFRRTAQLFNVKLEKPPKAIGRTTQDSLQSGIILGAAGQIDFIVTQIEKEIGKKCQVVATGGYAPLVWKVSKRIQKVDLTLTLKGLYYIYEILRGKKRSN
jgi:type III pantothenate kinase